MTNETNTSPDAVSAAIDALVSAGAGFHNTHVSEPTQGLILDGQTGEVTATTAAPSQAARIPDTGRDTAAEWDVIRANVAKHAEELAAMPEGPARDLKAAQFERLKGAALFDLERLQALDDQRTADREAASAASNETLAKAAFSGGDKARAEALSKALLEEEARVAAQTIVATRAEAIRQGRR